MKRRTPDEKRVDAGKHMSRKKSLGQLAGTIEILLKKNVTKIPDGSTHASLILCERKSDIKVTCCVADRMIRRLDKRFADRALKTFSQHLTESRNQRTCKIDKNSRRVQSMFPSQSFTPCRSQIQRTNNKCLYHFHLFRSEQNHSLTNPAA
jgi:hypothetical protein